MIFGILPIRNFGFLINTMMVLYYEVHMAEMSGSVNIQNAIDELLCVFEDFHSRM
jgi:hypothetical protein